LDGFIVRKMDKQSNSMSGSPQKVLILYTSAGAGHKAASHALKAVWNELYPQDVILTKDILSYTLSAFKYIYSSGYITLVTKLPFLWRLFYYRRDEIAKFKPPTRLGWALRWPVFAKFIRKMNKLKPDIIISTHFLASDGIAFLRKKKAFDFISCVVTTDYGNHSIWLSPCADRYYVPTLFMKAELETRLDYLNLAPDDIIATGIPINPKYMNLAPKAELRKKLSLDLEAFTILLFVNAFRGNDFDYFVEYISRVKYPLQILVIAGKKWPIPDRIKRKFIENNIAYRVFKYINFMEEVMAASDLAISKSGGLTTSECMAARLPLAVYRPYPGQEERNAEFLMQQGAGIKITQLAGIHYVINDLIENKTKLDFMAKRAYANSAPDATFKIIKDLKQVGDQIGKKTTHTNKTQASEKHPQQH